MMRDWLRRLASWIAQPKVFWLALLASAGSILVALLLGGFEHHFRLAGLFLQLLGILTVLRGIEHTSRLFARPSPFRAAMAWLTSFPMYHAQRRTAILVADAGSVSLSGHVTLRHRAAPDATVETRLHVLEGNIDAIEQQLDQLRQQIDESRRQSSRELEAERDERKRRLDALGTKLETTEAGGLGLSLVGVIWLLLGLVLSTASPELSRLFSLLAA